MKFSYVFSYFENHVQFEHDFINRLGCCDGFKVKNSVLGWCTAAAIVFLLFLLQKGYQRLI